LHIPGMSIKSRKYTVLEQVICILYRKFFMKKQDLAPGIQYIKPSLILFVLMIALRMEGRTIPRIAYDLDHALVDELMHVAPPVRGLSFYPPRKDTSSERVFPAGTYDYRRFFSGKRNRDAVATYRYRDAARSILSEDGL
jgi:hypothetical protein